MEKIRTYYIDGDTVEVLFTYDEESQRYIGSYPDFEQEPRYTPNGRPWVNVTHTGCPYADQEYDDCGSCDYIEKENSSDLIGVCMNDQRKLTERN